MGDWMTAVLVVVLAAALAVTTITIRETRRYAKVMHRQVMLIRAVRGLAFFVERHLLADELLPADVRSLINEHATTEDGPP